MKIYRFIIPFFATLTTFIAAQAQDQQVGGAIPSLQTADIITLGRVTDFQEITGNIGGQREVCGWAADIEVLHKFRGRDHETYKIFIGEKSGIPLLGERYFLTGIYNPVYNQRGDDAYAYCRDYSGTIDLSNYRYTSREFGGSVSLVDPYLSRKIGGDWLILDRAEVDRNADSYVEEGENPLHAKAYSGTDFVSFLQEYWTVIGSEKIQP